MVLPVMIDSGAYSAWTKKQEISLQSYAEYLRELLKRFPEALYVNLDVIGDGAASYHNWRELCKMGFHSLPIYHVNTDAKWLKRYLRHTDHLGLGAITSMSSNNRTWALDRIFEEYLIDGDRMPTAKVHGMGITSFSLMKRYPWHSIDSTSWLQAAMYGKTFMPRRRNGEWCYTDRPFVISFSSKSPSKEERGKHYSTVSPHEKEMLDQYLKEVGFAIGKSKMVDGKEEVIEEGLSNSHLQREYLNALFFSKFVLCLPWPRPFAIERPRGLLS